MTEILRESEFGDRWLWRTCTRSPFSQNFVTTPYIWKKLSCLVHGPAIALCFSHPLFQPLPLFLYSIVWPSDGRCSMLARFQLSTVWALASQSLHVSGGNLFQCSPHDGVTSLDKGGAGGVFRRPAYSPVFVCLGVGVWTGRWATAVHGSILGPVGAARARLHYKTPLVAFVLAADGRHSGQYSSNSE